MPANGAPGRISTRTASAVAIGVGAGVFILGLFFKRWISRSRVPVPVKSRTLPSITASAHKGELMADGDTPEIGRDRPDSMTRGSSRMRCTPSFSERGSMRQNSRQRNMFSASVPPVDADIICGAENCQELIKTMERALSTLELVKNRSDKDKSRTDALNSIIGRLRVLETDLSRLVSEAGYDDLREEASTFAGYASPRAGTLSVLSDDSFMSAFEDFGVTLDDGEILDLDKNQLLFLQEGFNAALRGEVPYRKARTEFCQCENDLEFSAKLWCLRQAFSQVLQDEHRRIWLAQCGRSLLGDLMKHSRQDPAPFYKAFDDMMEHFKDEQAICNMRDELTDRGVVDLGFFDIILDFIILDAFDDMKNPPSAIYSLTKNTFLSQSMRYSTISTIIWSMLKAKRQRLKYPGGFLTHYYNISEAVMPAITLGFLGTDSRMGDLCKFFKEQITQFVLNIFSEKHVRFTTLDELSQDIWIVMQSRAETMQSHISSELIPA